MNKIKMTAASTVCIIGTIAMTSAAQSEVSPMTYHISGPTTIQSGKDVEIEITIPNNASHSISLPEFAEQSNNIHVAGPSGWPATETEYGREINEKHGSGSISSVEIKPMDKIEMPCVISRIYDMKLPGTYVVWTERYAPGSYAIIASNKIAVTVTK